MASIALIDYGAGNLTSVRKGFAAVGAELFTPASPERARRARRRSSSRASATSTRPRRSTSEWRAAIRTAVVGGMPLLGICLGLQWLFEGSDEAPDAAGLGAAAGPLLPAAAGRVKVPHVGWNSLEIDHGRRALLDGVAERHAGVLHALVRGAGHRRHRRRDDARRARSRPRSSATGSCAACSSIPRSPATPGLRILANFSRRSTAEPCWPNASSPASTSATARSSKASTSRAAQRRRSGGARRALQRRRHRRARHPRRHGDDRRPARARGDDPRGVVAALHPARGRRRHPRRSRRRGGDRRRRRQGQHQHRRAGRSAARHARSRERYGSQAVVVAIDAKRERRSVRRLRAQRPRVAAAATPSTGRAKPKSRGAGEILLTSIDRDGTRVGLRLRADRRRVERGVDSGHRLGRRRHVRPLSRRLHRRQGRRRARGVGLSLLRARRRRI